MTPDQTRCLHCHARTTNGLTLCELCQRKLGTDLEYLPVYFGNLARWRPGKTGARQVPGSRVLYDGTIRESGTGDRISDALDEVLTALTSWARVLTDYRPLPRPHTLTDAVLSDDLAADFAETLVDNPAHAAELLCSGFRGHMASIATLEWCSEIVRIIGRHEERLRRLTETSVPGWYAGSCRRRVTMEGGLCGASTYVVPGLTWVTCGSCGTTTYARDHLEMILDEARGWVARPKALAEAIVALVDTEQSVPRLYTRIRQWAFQKDLEPVRRTRRGYAWSEHEGRVVVVTEDAGHARYRMGEVLDLVLTRSATRVKDGAAS